MWRDCVDHGNTAGILLVGFRIALLFASNTQAESSAGWGMMEAKTCNPHNFALKALLPIDGKRFSCYNALTYVIKEASSMGETPRKPNISIGLLAHV